MTTFTAEQKTEIKNQAKALGINVVGKSIEKLVGLIEQAAVSNAPEDASMEHVRKLATELKIKYTKSTTREELVFAIADVKGWANEKAEVIEFLISGGNIEELPGFTGVAPKPNSRETSAGGKVEPQEPKKPRKPTKATDAAKPASKPAKATSAKPKATGETVSIQDICEELGVEGRVARRKLRGSDIVKPSESGWNWEAGHADIAKVKELLKK